MKKRQRMRVSRFSILQKQESHIKILKYLKGGGRNPTNFQQWYSLSPIFSLKVTCFFYKEMEKRTYCAVSNKEKDLLGLLWSTDNIWKTSCFLRSHPVMRKSTLERCTLHTQQSKQRTSGKTASEFRIRDNDYASNSFWT